MLFRSQFFVFAGLSLRNPIIISSSGLTNSAGKNKKLAEDGAGAIVLKSLFEEQIMLEADQLKDPAFYPEASDYLEEYIRYESDVDTISITHDAKSRGGFVLGAVLAAEYTATHEGFLGMSDLFPFLND